MSNIQYSLRVTDMQIHGTKKKKCILSHTHCKIRHLIYAPIWPQFVQVVPSAVHTSQYKICTNLAMIPVGARDQNRGSMVLFFCDGLNLKEQGTVQTRIYPKMKIQLLSAHTHKLRLIGS